MASCLVLETTNRKPDVLIVVALVHVAAVVVQDHAVRVVTTVLRRTPEVRLEALVVVIPNPNAVLEAGRQRRETESVLIGDSVICRPTRLRLENLARS